MQRKQVHKPILQNPFTAQQFPHVENQQQVYEYLQNYLKPIQTLREMAIENAPKPAVAQQIVYGFNEVAEKLERGAQNMCVFVCTKDVPVMLSQHLPALCALKKNYAIQLPKGAASELSKILGVNEFEWQGVLMLPKTDESFFKFVTDNVAPCDLEWCKGFSLDIGTVSTSSPMGKVVKKSTLAQQKKDRKAKNDMHKKEDVAL